LRGAGQGLGEGKRSGGGREGGYHGGEAGRSIASEGGATRCRTGFGGKGKDLAADASGGTASRADASGQGRGEAMWCTPMLPPYRVVKIYIKTK
jgi:hypothetical protein